MTTHEEIQDEFRIFMNELARMIDEICQDTFGRKIGFALLMFEFDDMAKGPTGEGRINYLSNASRDDMRTALKELLARWEGMDVTAPTTKQ